MKVLQEPSNKKRKMDIGQWKERYFESFEGMEQATWKSDAKTSSLKQYNILLQNISSKRVLVLFNDKIESFENIIQKEFLSF